MAGSVRAAAIGTLNLQRAGSESAQWAGTRNLFTTPVWAQADQDFKCVFYPEPEAEVGEAAPDFSLPGEGLQSGRVVGRRAPAASAVLRLPFRACACLSSVAFIAVGLCACATRPAACLA